MDPYGVLVFRQQVFTVDEQLAFATRFDGQFHPHFPSQYPESVMNMFKGLLVPLLAFVGVSALASGEETYKAVCASCHANRVANAPQVGDKAKWAPLIAEGQVILTAHGYVGVRAMPPKGGKPDLSVAGFAEALNHMVNQSGGNWKTPGNMMLKDIEAEIARRQKGKRD